MANQQLKQQSTVTLAISQNGFEFDYLQDRWVLNRNVTLNLGFLTQFNETVAEDVRETLVYFAENNSAPHARNLTDNLKLYLKVSNANDFSELGLLAFKGFLPKKMSTNFLW